MSNTYYILDPQVVTYTQRSVYNTLLQAQTAAAQVMAAGTLKSIDIYRCVLDGTVTQGSPNYTPAGS